MSRFATKSIVNIKGKQKFEQLIILPDDTDLSKITPVNELGIWDNYSASLEEKYRGSFRGLEAIMDMVANLKGVSKEKFRDITPNKESVKEFEIKYQDLRAYGIKMANGKLMLLGGYKNNQQPDITAFRGLKKKYLEFLQNQENKHGKGNKK